MATKKKAAPAKKVATMKAAPAKKVVEKVLETTKEVLEWQSSTPATFERKPSQKEQIIVLADKGLTITEIADISGLKKANVQWYFSKLKLSKIR